MASFAQTASAVPAEGMTSTTRNQVFRCEGEYWTVTYAQRTFRLRDGKGMHYLAYLLARPNLGVPVGQLVDAIGAPMTGWHRTEACAPSEYADRARSAVTKRLRAAIAKITTYHPALGHHLTSCIRTGYVCLYNPDPDSSATWLV